MDIYIYIYYSLIVAEVIFGVFVFRKLHKSFKALVVLLLFTIISEFISRWLAYEIQNSNPPYHFFLPLQYLLMAMAYLYLFPNSLFVRYYVLCSIVSSFILSLLNSIYFQPLLQFPSNVFMFNSLFTLGLICITYIKILNLYSPLPLFKQGFFWLNTANLIYYSVTFLYFAFINYFHRAEIISRLVDDVIYYVTLLTYFLYGLSIFFGKKLNSLSDGE